MTDIVRVRFCEPVGPRRKFCGCHHLGTPRSFQGASLFRGYVFLRKGTSEQIEALSLGDTGNEVIVVAGWEFFPEQFGEVATQQF